RCALMLCVVGWSGVLRAEEDGGPSAANAPLSHPAKTEVGTARATGSAGASPSQVSFELDVMPILTAKGCNQGACHGKARGQNGFQLSLLGFDADFDYAALTQQARGRRVFLAAPERSLLLQKATASL